MRSQPLVPISQSRHFIFTALKNMAIMLSASNSSGRGSCRLSTNWHLAVGIEACASSHYWSRELQALEHTVRLMPPAYVRPYVKRQRLDRAAENLSAASRRARARRF